MRGRRHEAPCQPLVNSRPPSALPPTPLQTTEAMHAISVRHSHTTLTYNRSNHRASWEQSVIHDAPRTSQHRTDSEPTSLTVLSKHANSRGANNDKYVWECGEV